MTPQIADAQDQCTPLSFVTVEPNNSLTVQRGNGIQAPFIALDGTSTQISIPVNASPPLLTCICLETGPFPRSGSAATSNCVKMRCDVQYDGQLYLEVAGGFGASITYFTDTAVAPVTYPGGAPGVVFGTALVKTNDILDITFGYSALPAAAISIAEGSQQVVPGGGGLGSLLGGSNGGGCTTVTRPTSAIPLLVAPGGGGAGRNAAGGNAGSEGPYQAFVVPSQRTHGLNGQSVLDPVNDQVFLEPNSSTLSGEGGSTKGGRSLDPNGVGKSLQGGNASDFLSSGGGGGAGYFGGGAGFTNGSTKPNNIQGAGGGGSSFSSLALSTGSYVRSNSGAVSTYVTFGIPSSTPSVGSSALSSSVQSQDAATSTVFQVSNNGSGSFNINGASNPTITVERGITYEFVVAARGHPFRIQTTPGPYNSQAEYTRGLTNSGAQVGTIVWQVAANTPAVLYYACQFHASMNGQIRVVDATGAPSRAARASTVPSTVRQTPGVSQPATQTAAPAAPNYGY